MFLHTFAILVPQGTTLWIEDVEIAVVEVIFVVLVDNVVVADVVVPVGIKYSQNWPKNPDGPLKYTKKHLNFIKFLFLLILFTITKTRDRA